MPGAAGRRARRTVVFPAMHSLSPHPGVDQSSVDHTGKEQADVALIRRIRRNFSDRRGAATRG